MKHSEVSKLILALFCIVLLNSCGTRLYEDTELINSTKTTLNIAIPTAGNCWVMDHGVYTSTNVVTSEGIRNWNNPNQTIRTFFYLVKAGKVSLGLRASVNTGDSKLKVSFQNKSQDIILTKSGFVDTYLGDFQVDEPGYYFVEIKGLEKEGTDYADIDDILVGGINSSGIKFIKDDFYFARRGPSVHLNFELPQGVDQVEWFYSEITIPENQDVVGSYFMANGFGEGYFGIQVNSPTERKILFSIWSPYHTDNPSDIPEEYKVKLLKKGAGVTTGEFGNEGSGGQSFKTCHWRTGVNYGFLVGVKPQSEGYTDYTAYFHDPEENKWSLIAQFRRPKTNTYLNHLYSFLENFIPDQGVFARKGLYGNQWVYDNAGWHELSKITFTADDTARKSYRLDYSGGLENDGFYLKNCGFTNDHVFIDSKFERGKQKKAPEIDFSQLE
jgi:hypothetical protein